MTNKPNYECVPPLLRAGISHDDALALRRIAMTLHRWHEMECGASDGHIEREMSTGIPFYQSGHNPKMRWRISDREKGALRRLTNIMVQYPTLQSYVQGDPRGASLYILRSGDVPPGEQVDAYYSRGLAVYK